MAAFYLLLAMIGVALVGDLVWENNTAGEVTALDRTVAGYPQGWLLAAGGPAAVAAHCVAVSTNETAMDEFGIAAYRRLAMWDWVGGRYSVWSAVGVTVALGVGDGDVTVGVAEALEVFAATGGVVAQALRPSASTGTSRSGRRRSIGASSDDVVRTSETPPRNRAVPATPATH